MPFYTFRCTNCGYEKDYLVRMGTTETECSECGEKATKRPSYRFAATGLPNGHITQRGGVSNSRK